MNYLDYKIASERHLETCLRLKEVVSDKYAMEGLSNLEIKNRDELLSNIYYLAGYVIECIVSYGILKLINIDSIYRTHNLRGLKELASIYSSHKVSFDYKDNFARWSITNPKHSIEKNLTFFTVEAGLTGMNIRGIDKNIDGDLKKLVKYWNAEYRYYFKEKTILDVHKVFSFLNLAEEIHIGIRTKITND
jgi:hypothetical protein